MGASIKRWTKDEDAYLRAHLHKLSTADIGAALGRTQNAVWQRSRRLQIADPSFAQVVRGYRQRGAMVNAPQRQRSAKFLDDDSLQLLTSAPRP